jgi:hypothetical protein
MEIGFPAEMSHVRTQANAEGYEIEEWLSQTNNKRGQNESLVRNEVPEKDVVYPVREIHLANSLPVSPPDEFKWSFPFGRASLTQHLRIM